MKTELTRADILAPDAYEAVRATEAARIRKAKRDRRVSVGPFATFTFENYETMWLQAHEMLRAEKGGEDQIADELAAYNPLIPKGRDLVATLMFEIGDPVRRAAELGRMGGVEETVRLHVGGDVIAAVPERDVERSTAEGRTSSVHFLHFPFTGDQARAFVSQSADVRLAITQPRYAHAAVLPGDVIAALISDFAPL